eukprot:s2174_g10.t1
MTAYDCLVVSVFLPRSSKYESHFETQISQAVACRAWCSYYWIKVWTPGVAMTLLLVPGSRDAKLVASSKKSVYIIVAARTFN